MRIFAACLIAPCFALAQPASAPTSQPAASQPAASQPTPPKAAPVAAPAAPPAAARPSKAYPPNVALGYPKDPQDASPPADQPWLEDPARFHAGFGFGMRFYDARLDPLLKEGYQGNAHLTAGVRLVGDLWIDVTRRFALQTEQLHDWIDARFSDDSWRAQLAYRRHITGMLLAHAQVGPAYHWLEVELGDEEILAKAETWGASASAGVIFLPIAAGHMPKLRKASGDLGVGFGVRLTYDYVPAVEMRASGANLGELNASGWGWMFSNVIQF